MDVLAELDTGISKYANNIIQLPLKNKRLKIPDMVSTLKAAYSSSKTEMDRKCKFSV